MIAKFHRLIKWRAVIATVVHYSSIRRTSVSLSSHWSVLCSDNIIRYLCRTQDKEENAGRIAVETVRFLLPRRPPQSEPIYRRFFPLLSLLYLYRANKRLRLSATDSYRVVYAEHRRYIPTLNVLTFEWRRGGSRFRISSETTKALPFSGGSETRRVARSWQRHIYTRCAYVCNTWSAIVFIRTVDNNILRPGIVEYFPALNVWTGELRYIV